MSFVYLDFDNTIIHGDAGPLFGLHLFQRRKARIEEAPHGPARVARKTLLWGGAIPYLTWMGLRAALYKARAVRRSSMVRSAYKGLKGVPVHVMENTLDDFVAESVVPRIYPEIRDAMEAHHAAGRTCVIITTGMEMLVERVLPYLPKGTQLMGCTLEEKDGRLTGRVLDGPLYGQHKADLIAKHCQENDVNPVNCWAYSDHYSDHHMLQAVGHAVCVNPAGRLTEMADKEGWDILRLDDPQSG